MTGPPILNAVYNLKSGPVKVVTIFNHNGEYSVKYVEQRGNGWERWGYAICPWKLMLRKMTEAK